MINGIFHNRTSRWLVPLLRLLMGAVFLGSGMAKIADTHAFVTTIVAFNIVGPQASLLAAAIIPWLEVIVGACIVGGVFLGGAMITASALLLLFAIVLSTALARNLSINCGCFGIGSDSSAISIGTLFRSLSLLGIAVWIYLSLVIPRSAAIRSSGNE